MSKGRRKGALQGLPQREKQILDLLFKNGECTANDLGVQIDEKLNNATIRTILRKLEQKGYIVHQKNGNQYVYKPVLDNKTAAKNTFKDIVNTFFTGSFSDAVATFVEQDSLEISEEKKQQIIKIIEEAKKGEE